MGLRPRNMDNTPRLSECVAEEVFVHLVEDEFSVFLRPDTVGQH
ncbi:hypothetical protein [Trueperella pyogenes]